jgi:hypothetical protein
MDGVVASERVEPSILLILFVVVGSVGRGGWHVGPAQCHPVIIVSLPKWDYDISTGLDVANISVELSR